jgi:transposase
MSSAEIFALALGLESPWKITDLNFETSNKQKILNINVGVARGTKFPDKSGNLCSVHDTQKRTWRHLNFFEHRCYINCNVPRIKTAEGKVQLIQVPWSRSGSGFTLLFEAFTMSLIENEMPINKIGRLVGENAHRLWTIFNYWIEHGYAADELTNITKIGVDETSQKKGHKYVTVAVDLDQRRVIHVTEGKGKSTIKEVQNYLFNKGVNAEEIKHASMDMSPSFISGVKEYFPNAEIHFDRFHVVKLLNEAMNKVRQLERKEHTELKGYKYLFLKNKNKLSNDKLDKLGELTKLFPTLGDAYRLKELFNDLWDQKNKEEAVIFLEDWFEQVENAGIESFKQFSRTIKAHLSGVINFCETRINNGILEGLNSKIQLAKRRARGYRLTKNFVNMIYFLCGKLKFDYPLYSS